MSHDQPGPARPAAIADELRQLLAAATGRPELARLTLDTPLFGDGVGLDSLTGTLLLRQVRQRFGVDVAAEDLNLDALATLGSLTAFVDSHLAGAGGYLMLPVPPAGCADVWWLDISTVTVDRPEVAELSLDEHKRAASFAFRADRRRYTAAHVMLRRVLSGYVDIPPSSLIFRREPCPRCGKPTGRRPCRSATGCTSRSRTAATRWSSRWRASRSAWTWSGSRPAACARCPRK